jgi:hypothetical protein
MKKYVVIVLLFITIIPLSAKPLRGTRALLELGPKGSLYIGENTRFGLGAEFVVHPLRTIGLRFDIAELSFGDYTMFYFNELSMDALVYIPMQNVDPYVHAGFGIVSISNGGSSTVYSIRCGMGFIFQMKRGTGLFIEPGIIIAGNGDTDVVFRLSFGARFSMLK